MADIHSFLVEWAINFIKNKDIVSKKVEKIEHRKDGFDLYVKYKDREQYFIITAKIADIEPVLQKINSSGHISSSCHFSILTLNSNENFESLLKNWSRIINFKFLNIIFINPFSATDKKWIIFPHTHHKICDESSLEAGLRAMFEGVEIIDEQQLAEKIASDTLVF